MPYSDRAAARVRAALARRRGVVERRMFGGLAFMVRGHMAVGVLDSNLVLRLGKEGAAAALTTRHVRPMDFTGTPMTSMVYVELTGYRTKTQLDRWIAAALAFVRTLPPKEPTTPRRRA
jgi:TfoX/Sxy family transcriptional regulator of competence genes